MWVWVCVRVSYMCACVWKEGSGSIPTLPLHYVFIIILAQQFTVQPESVVQAEGLEAVFECLCPGAVSHTWGLDGVFLAADQFPPNVTRVTVLGDSPARLIIPATPQYNNIVVQCRAIVDEGGGSFRSVLSNNGTLRVQGIDRLHFMGKSYYISYC